MSQYWNFIYKGYYKITIHCSIPQQKKLSNVIKVKIAHESKMWYGTKKCNNILKNCVEEKEKEFVFVHDEQRLNLKGSLDLLTLKMKQA